MSENSAIEWTDHTWSPVWGCTQVSLAKSGGGGCDNCYAMTLAHRFGHGWNGAPMREFGEHHWNEPLRWNKRAIAAGRRARVFPSMCDPFDKDWPAGVRDRFWQLIAATPALDWLLLTKRIGNARAMMPANFGGPHFSNVWLGSTVINQEEADRDIPKLLETPARVRFLSIEPMLGEIDITLFLWGKHEAIDVICQNCPRDADCSCGYETRAALKLPALHWVIAGGESGPHARPAHPDWFRSLRDQCAPAGVPFLFKQWGEWGQWSRDLTHNEAAATRAGYLPTRHYFRDVAGNTVGLPMLKVGKKLAGRLLDGVQHDGYPA